jgi:hypothetical protein
MAKISISIPDELLAQADEYAPPNMTRSELVQLAVGELVSRSGKPVFARAAPESQGDYAVVRTRLMREARALYERGYREGMEVSGHIGWAELDLLATLGWDLQTWARHPGPSKALLLVVKRLSESGDSGRGEEEIVTEGSLYFEVHSWSTTFQHGIVDALRTTWDAVSTDDDLYRKVVLSLPQGTNPFVRPEAPSAPAQEGPVYDDDDIPF